jgi:hypothetical protein
MATSKQQSIRLTAEDVTILDEIQRRTGLLSYSNAMRWALRQYAQQNGIDFGKPRAKKR